MANTIIINNQIANETRIWKNLVQSSGGGFQWNSVAIANAFIKKVKTKSYYSKLIYLLPMLGTGIGAARVPLVDKLAVGAATSTAFVDGDFNQALGLQGNGTTKYLNSLINPQQLGTTLNGGLGWWENNYTGTGNVEPIGSYDETGLTSRCVLDLRSGGSPFRAFRWGAPSNFGGDTSSASNAHYYGQRSSNISRQLFRNAIAIGSTNTTLDNTGGTFTTGMLICGAYNGAGAFVGWPGRCAVAYMTDGTFTTDEISDFDTLLRAYLIGPTGKP